MPASAENGARRRALGRAQAGGGQGRREIGGLDHRRQAGLTRADIGRGAAVDRAFAERPDDRPAATVSGAIWSTTASGTGAASAVRRSAARSGLAGSPISTTWTGCSSSMAPLSRAAWPSGLRADLARERRDLALGALAPGGIAGEVEEPGEAPRPAGRCRSASARPARSWLAPGGRRRWPAPGNSRHARRPDSPRRGPAPTPRPARDRPCLPVCSNRASAAAAICA